MATKNEFNSNIPIEILKGGTGRFAFVEDSVVCGGTASTNPLQSVAEVGNAGYLLTSQGAAALPEFQNVISIWELLAADPGSPSAGDSWYNTVSHLFKGAIPAPPLAWVLKANFLLADTNSQYGCAGTAELALSSGEVSVSPFYTVIYELASDSYSSKTVRNNASRFGRIYGTSSATAFSSGGRIGVSQTNTTEVYVGGSDSWTNKANLNTARNNQGGAGSSTDGLVFGGTINPPNQTRSTERYDGTSWTNKALLAVKKNTIGGTGTAPDALSVAGVSAGVMQNTVERYDGGADSWTAKATVSVGISQPGASGPAGDALHIGGLNTGSGARSALCEAYDGGLDSWSAAPTLNVARYGFGAAGASSTNCVVCDEESLPLGIPGTTERLEVPVIIVTFTVT